MVHLEVVREKAADPEMTAEMVHLEVVRVVVSVMVASVVPEMTAAMVHLEVVREKAADPEMTAEEKEKAEMTVADEEKDEQKDAEKMIVEARRFPRMGEEVVTGTM